MSARAAPSEIERLIEIGLTAYGRGDLDGALLAWEEVLGHDPTEARALGYVDYVRQNYEVISGGAPDRVPLGLTGAPDDYDVELDFGDPPGPPGRAQPVMHVIDEGWSLDDERAGVGFGRHAAPTVELGECFVELDDDRAARFGQGGGHRAQGDDEPTGRAR